ncbi:GntR family transcriptional regulator [Peptacetobacter hominis]|uniref:GntR family transcriptional regulator n=1 Tax=Peptacetobacter hominis TaxID=2743610 RepID=A0A544QVM2_9FIRM|nr:GntR family transcriptional regulator [Peptacetobacter hominis]TQQ84747.1 GntR family transcriptional regulator [Peptacetobacter hominis]
MYFTIDSSSPIYLQIIKYIKRQIIIGELKPGDEIPSRREMASSMKINLNTVQKAYKEMNNIGLIVTYKNHQSSITTDNRIISALKEELISESLKSFIQEMKSINVSKEEVIQIIDKFYDK